VLLVAQTASRADEVEKSLFLVVEPDDVIASNTMTGRFDRLDLAAKERILEYKVGNAAAVVVTNQRFAGYGVLAGGWQTLRREAGEAHESIEVQDYSATVVTDDRVLNFNGRTGAWNQVRRSVQFR
jgi:RecB family exonuclease